MANDSLDELLRLEDEFYREGFEAGVSDSAYAGMIEGKVFGIEKGYEKAFELARLHGRGLLWQARMQSGEKSCIETSTDSTSQSLVMSQIISSAGQIPKASRLQKHIENLVSISSDQDLSKDNSDEAVTEFDDRLAKAKTKAKVIANITGEAIGTTSQSDRGIEDSAGLNARQ